MIHISRGFRSFIAFSCLAAGTALHAEEGPWLIRGRALQISPINKSDSIPALAVPADGIEVGKKLVPELDITYFLTKNLAAELVLAYTKLDAKVTSSAIGAFDAGSFNALPPTLSLQWHFMPDGQIRPYVGAGVNYTRINKVELSVPTTPAIPLSLERSSFGLAVQAGVDIKMSGPWYLNFDLKKVQIRADVKDSTGAKVSTVRLDPWLIGVGVGYRF